MMGIIGVLFFVAIVVAAFILITIKRMLYVVPPNQAMILSGAKRKIGNKVLGFRVVCGGRALR
ncbi:MAG TPA: hypothetical protein PLM08_24390, partial [Polyangiaceae bacterium]|nr:hypothetical protein [Polyangiaceae bacterium]